MEGPSCADRHLATDLGSFKHQTGDFSKTTNGTNGIHMDIGYTGIFRRSSDESEYLSIFMEGLATQWSFA